jgi:hypothetical protein
MARRAIYLADIDASGRDLREFFARVVRFEQPWAVRVAPARRMLSQPRRSR